MKYTIQSGKYVLKNILYLLPFAIIPALFLSFSTDENSLNAVVESFFSGNIALFARVLAKRAQHMRQAFKKISVNCPKGIYFFPTA